MRIFSGLAIALLMAPGVYAERWSVPVSLTSSILEPAITTRPVVTSNGTFIVGAWTSDELDNSIMIQRWTADGSVMEPVAHVLVHSLGSTPTRFQVRQIVPDGSDFLVIYNEGGTLTIARVDAGLSLISRTSIPGIPQDALVDATSTEILVLRGRTASFYTISGQLLSEIPDSIPPALASSGMVSASHIGGRFLLAIAGQPPQESRVLHTVALRPDGTSNSPTTIVLPAGALGAIDASAGDDRFLVSVVQGSSAGGTITQYAFDAEGHHLGTGVLYDTPRSYWSLAPQVEWNGSAFEVYWNPPDNLVLLRSLVSSNGAPLATDLLDIASPLARVVATGGLRTFLWIEPPSSYGVTTQGHLLIASAGASATRIEGKIASFRTQMQTDPQTVEVDGGELLLWTELIRETGTWEARAAFVDSEGRSTPFDLPNTCPEVSMATSGTETALLWSCNRTLSAAVYDHDKDSMSEPVLLESDAAIVMTSQAIAWNGDGWTIGVIEISPEEGYYGDARVFRLGRDLLPIRPPTSIATRNRNYGVVVEANEAWDFAVTLQVVPGICRFDPCPNFPVPVDAYRIDPSGTLVESRTLFETGSLSTQPFTIDSTEDGFVYAAGTDQSMVLGLVPDDQPLASSTEIAIADAVLDSVDIATVGNTIWLAATTSEFFSYTYPNANRLRVYQLAIDDQGPHVVDSWTVSESVDSASIAPRGSQVRLYSSEMLPRHDQGLSFRIFMRELEPQVRKRGIGRR